jgi:hypothetical protein
MTQVRATILSIAHGCLDSHMLSLHPVCGNRAVNTSNCIDGFRSLVPVQRDERGNVRIQQDIALWNGGTTPRIVPSSAASRSGSCDRNLTSELLTVAIQKLNLGNSRRGRAPTVSGPDYNTDGGRLRNHCSCIIHLFRNKKHAATTPPPRPIKHLARSCR